MGGQPLTAEKGQSADGDGPPGTECGADHDDGRRRPARADGQEAGEGSDPEEGDQSAHHDEPEERSEPPYLHVGQQGKRESSDEPPVGQSPRFAEEDQSGRPGADGRRHLQAAGVDGSAEVQHVGSDDHGEATEQQPRP